MGEKKYKKCDDCSGSGHISIPQPEGAVPCVEHCLRCRGTGRVEVDNTPEPAEADRRRREFYTGDNT